MAKDGEKHVADVETEHGLVIEFQHSFLKTEERRSREAFYEQLVWVVDGLRRSRDAKRFDELIRQGLVFNLEPLEVFLPRVEGALLRDWWPSNFPVFFDFGRKELWCLKPNKTNGAIVVPVEIETFVDWCHGRSELMALSARPSPSSRPH